MEKVKTRAKTKEQVLETYFRRRHMITQIFTSPAEIVAHIEKAIFIRDISLNRLGQKYTGPDAGYFPFEFED